MYPIPRTLKHTKHETTFGPYRKSFQHSSQTPIISPSASSIHNKFAAHYCNTEPTKHCFNLKATARPISNNIRGN